MSVLISISYAAESDTSGLPQFNPEHFSSQIFWAVISFVTLLLLLNKYVLPLLRQTLDDRTQKIQDDLNDAQQQRVEAEQLLTQYQQQLREAHLQAKNIIDQAHQQITAEHTMLMQAFDKKIQRKKDDFKVELAYAKGVAIKDIHNMSVQIAILATAKLITHNITPAEANAMVDEAITELKTKV